MLTVTHKMDFYTHGIRNWLVDSLSARRPRFKPDVLYMRFLVYKASLRKGFLRVLRYTVVRIIPPMLHINTLTLRRLMSYIYGAPILDVSRSHTTTQHSR